MASENETSQFADSGSSAKRKFANRFLYLSTFFALILFGGSLFAMMLYASARSPESILSLIRPPFKGGFTFFVIFNSSMEWLLLPATLFLNWRLSARRKPLLWGAILYYCARAWTYIYFVPAIFKLMAVPATTPIFTPVGARNHVLGQSELDKVCGGRRPRGAAFIRDVSA